MSDLDTEPRSSRLWIFAAVAALALHLGGAALAVAHLKGSEPDDSGTEAIEIGLDVSSLHRDPTDLPAGPDADASVASPAIAEQKAEVKATELPKDSPTETEDPDRVVTPNDSKKPKEDDAKLAAVQATASTQSVAAEATAMPTNKASPEALRSVAPVPGTGDRAHQALMNWEKELSAHLNKYKRYPPERSQKSAEILVGFAIDRVGHVLSASVIKGSGDTAFDEAALAMVRKSDPVPRPPPTVADQSLNLTVPVIFRVKGKS